MSDATTATTTITDGGAAPETITDPAKVGDGVNAGAADTTTAEGKAEETKGEEASGKDVKPEVPEVYTIKPSEGYEIDQDAMALVTPIMKKFGVTQEGAQEFADSFVQIQQQQIAKQSAKWLEASRADKEIGGAAFDGNAKVVQEFFAKIATPELKALYDSTGFGNHPEVLRSFLKLAKLSAQDTHIPATAEAAQSDVAKRLFPNTK